MNEKLIINTLDNHTATLNEHTKILNRHEKILNEHTKKLDEHTEMLNSIQRTLIIIEDAVTNKIPALFDRYIMHQQHQKETDKKLTDITKVTEIHSAKITTLETAVKNNSRKLEKILS